MEKEKCQTEIPRQLIRRIEQIMTPESTTKMNLARWSGNILRKTADLGRRHKLPSKLEMRFQSQTGSLKERF